MKNKFLKGIICLLLSLVFVMGMTACDSECKLSTPTISLKEDRISWSPVDNADKYDIYENQQKITSTSSTVYTITQAVVGTYEYTIKAISNNSNYTDSDMSNSVSYKVRAQLATPVISLEDNSLTWDTVANAENYDVYENDILIATVANDASAAKQVYAIIQQAVGIYEYTVKATTTNDDYKKSELSNAVAYEVKAPKTKLAAPVLNLDKGAGIITWQPIENASRYSVTMNGTNVGTQVGTTYTINVTESGEYIFKVKAIPGNTDNYVESEYSDPVTYTFVAHVAVALDAPVLILEKQTGVIVWEPVENAFSYNVTMNGKNMGSQIETEYKINVTEAGEYVFRVKAIPGNSYYIESEYSEPVTYTYVTSEPGVLAAPVVHVNEETNTIYWDKVDNAEGYAVYENGFRIADVTETSYVIPTVAPGEYTYTVRAIGDGELFESSGFSNAVSLTIGATEVPYTINVVVPEGYTAPITVGLYDGEKEVVRGVAVLDTESSQATVELEAINDRDYIVKVIGIASGFTSTQATVTARRTMAALKIMRYDSSSALKIGTNTFTVRANSNPDSDERGTQFDFTFLAEESGIYSIDATAETKRMSIFVDNELIIEGPLVTIGWFSMEKGQVVQISCMGADAGQYVFDLVKGEVPAPNLQIGTEYGDRANYIPPIECTRKLVIETPGYFEFCFTPSLDGRRVTMTIDGKDYVFSTDETDIDRITLALNRGEHEITFKVENTIDFLEYYYIYFFISYAQG